MGCNLFFLSLIHLSSQILVESEGVMSKGVDFTANRKVTAEIYYKLGPGYLKSIFGSDRKHWGPEIKKRTGSGCIFWGGGVSISTFNKQDLQN